jgi:hypothetical protein
VKEPQDNADNVIIGNKAQSGRDLMRLENKGDVTKEWHHPKTIKIIHSAGSLKFDAVTFQRRRY